MVAVTPDLSVECLGVRQGSGEACRFYLAFSKMIVFSDFGQKRDTVVPNMGNPNYCGNHIEQSLDAEV